MKKVLSLLFAMIVVFSLAGCVGKPASAPATVPDLSPHTSSETDSSGTTKSGVPGTLQEQPVDAAAVCYLPVRITGSYDIPKEAQEKLGYGSYEEDIATYEYDDAGRLVCYTDDTRELMLSFQYLDEVALPAVLELGEGTAISFTEPRWAQDAPEIVLDVVYGEEVMPADFRVSEIQKDDDGKLVSANIIWGSQIGEEAYPVAGHTFDDKDNLLFIPLDGEEYRYQYGADGQIVGLEYWESYGGDAHLLETVWVDEAGHPVSVEDALGDNGIYTDMGDGRYRYEWEGNWEELVFDESGNLVRSSWYAQASGITYTYIVEYDTMSASQYIGTPVDYTNVYPMLHYRSRSGSASYAQAAGHLQLPAVSQLILALW